MNPSRRQKMLEHKKAYRGFSTSYKVSTSKYGTSGKTYCHYMVFQLPAKILRAHSLKSGHKVRVTLNWTTGQCHPFAFADLARDEDKAREIGLRFEGTTEVNKRPWGTRLTHQSGEQRNKLITDVNGKRWKRPANR